MSLAIASAADAQNPAQSQRTTMGLVHIGAGQVARLTFHLPLPERAAPGGFDTQPAVDVQLRFLDRDGKILLNSDGLPIPPPPPLSVRRGEAVTLDLVGFDLAGAGSVAVRPEIEVFHATVRGFSRASR